ncbi:asparagine synthase (glutamine-hydrolyzing) [Goodfellowiella coeruleoviolacea]|uniref:asparagine synthase (glutamine-hydrolyzing) n=1 Tax=Goodfellowiella coeruleoviolacea TaxID=334858 RepID=A0AAE3GAA9_9PSEU|nr:asparagine synthase (glutamine-hydrolyzing) [Goodfellowiella coeruleoviolacea]MCP2163304.1 asparagine synthase (glutamine-hydrolyzing) [Goodfellowiella coeruleoviolacea]
MCGITGWVSFDADLTNKRGVLDAMTETMACRGPDASGVWLRRHAAFGHRRLAVIDLPGGVQPMTADTPRGPVGLVYSGEVYNFVELRDQLRARGHRFHTDSDTEVVLRGYLEWGAELAEHLNGMYAFAIWDDREEKLLLVRDRMGVKPLYYYPTADGVLFGSEPKAILANPLARRVVDADGLRELIGYTKAPGWSLWKDMYEVEPGTITTVHRGGVQTRTYWKLTAQPHDDDLDTTVDTVRELLTDIVRRQLVADVPRCVLLSGGLDSSAVTGLAAAELAEQGELLRTFSVDYVGQEKHFQPDEMRDTPDSPFVRDVVAHVGTEHEDVMLDPHHLTDPAVRRACVTARDMPSGLGDVETSLYLLFKAIRRKSTVALSGEAADEVFGGYRWFFEDAPRQGKTFPWLAFRNAVTSNREELLRPDVRAHLDVPTYVADQYATAVAAVEHVDGESEFERRMRVICNLNLTRWVRVLLDRKDRTSMAVGLEVRVPFCDQRLVEYVYNTPWSFKNFDGREKSLLRHASKHVLPDSVRDRVKSPYPSTQDPGYAVALQQQAKEVLAEPDSPVFDLVSRSWLQNAVQADAATLHGETRHGLDRVLDLHHWFDIYQPQIDLS